MSIEWNVNDRVANNMPPDGEPTPALQELTEMEMLSVAVGESLADQLEQLKKKEDNDQSHCEPIDQQQDAAYSDCADLQEIKEDNNNKRLDDNNNDEAKDKTDCNKVVSDDTVIEAGYRSEVEDTKDLEDKTEEKQNIDDSATTNNNSSSNNNTEGQNEYLQSTAVSSSVHMNVMSKSEKPDTLNNSTAVIEDRAQRKQTEPFKRQTFPLNYRASTSRSTYSTNKNFNYIENKSKALINSTDDRFKYYSVQKPESRPPISDKSFHRTDEPRTYRRHQCYYPDETSTSTNYQKPSAPGSSWDAQKRIPPRRSYDPTPNNNLNSNQNYQEKGKRETAVYRRSVKFNDYNYPKANSRINERPSTVPKNNYASNNPPVYSGPVSRNRSSGRTIDEKTNTATTQQDKKPTEMPVFSDSHSQKRNESMQLVPKPADENYNNKDKFEEVTNNDPPLINSINSLQITDQNTSGNLDMNKTKNKDLMVQMDPSSRTYSQASNTHIDYRNPVPRSNVPEYLNIPSNYLAQPDDKMQQMGMAYPPPIINPYSSVKESPENVVLNISQNIAQNSMKPPAGFYNSSVPRNRWNYVPQEMMYPGSAMAFPNYLPPHLVYMPYACGPNWNPQLTYHTTMMQHPQFNSTMYAHRDDYMNKTRNPTHIQTVDNYQRQSEAKQPNYGYHMPYDMFGCDYKQQEYNNSRTGFPTKPEHYNRAVALNNNQKYSPYPYVTAIDTNYMNQSIYNQTGSCDYKRVTNAQSHSTSGDVDFNQDKSTNEEEPSIPPLISPRDCMNYDSFVPNSQARLSSTFSYNTNPADGEMSQMGMGRGRQRLTNQ